MTDDEIKNRIRQLLKNGSRISSPAIVSSQPKVIASLAMCSTPYHRCIACGGDRPRFEFNPPDSKICLHERCHRLWVEVQTHTWKAGSLRKRIALALIALVTGCSTTTVDVDNKMHELGITRPEAKNLVKSMAALRAACKQSDSTSIQVCQTYNDQLRLIPDMEQFLNNSLFTPNALNGAERSAFNNTSVLGAAYREYIEAKQANADSERLWRSFAAGAALGTLFSRPTPSPQLNCSVINAHTPSPSVQC